jgi:hypothetical protein
MFTWGVTEEQRDEEEEHEGNAAKQIINLMPL